MKRFLHSPWFVLGAPLLLVFVLLCIVSQIPFFDDTEWFDTPLAVFVDLGVVLLTMLVILLKSPKRYGKFGTIALFCLSPVCCFLLADSLNGVNIFNYDPWTALFNLLCYAMIHLFVYALTGRFRIAVMVSVVLSFVFGLVNHFVTAFRGSPFLPWDILSARTAFSVASNYTFSITPDLIGAVLVLILLLLLAARMSWNSTLLNKNILHIFISRLAIAGILVGYGAILLGTHLPDTLGIVEFPWNQSAAYRANGSLTNFLLNIKYLIIERPEGYSSDAVSEIAEEAESEQTTSEVLPHILVVMNESFSDLSVVGDFETTEDYMPFFHSLQNRPNAVTGNTYVSVHGGTTCNSEFEMLTGNTMAFFPTGSVPYQQYLKQQTTALPSLLRTFGYRADALHPYYPEGWNRDAVYPLMGFETFYDKSAWSSAHYVRQYISDTSDYDKLIERYEERTDGERLFLFNITMQNHSGYTYPYYTSTIHLTDMDGDYPQVEQYLSLIRESDAALEELIAYLEQQDEPILLLFFGDHQPAVESDFYEELYGKPLDQLTLAELQKRYITPYLIWANYDLPLPESTDLSANYLSSLLLKTAGISLPIYNQFLLQLQEQIPIINANGYRGSDGIWYELNESSPYSNALNDYRILQYNNLFDPEHRAAAVFDGK